MNEITDPFWKTSEEARHYDAGTKTSFARVYPLIAAQIFQRTGITTGLCLDAGAGPAPLAIALALRSDLRVTTLDSSSRMQSLVTQNIHALLLEEKIFPVLGDVHDIPVRDMTYDLVVSRGSYHAWRDRSLAFMEIRRVLKPDGMAYVGGGYGSSEIRNEVFTSRKKGGFNDDPEHHYWTRFKKLRSREIEDAMHDARFSDYQILDDDSGFWMLLHP